MIAEGKVDALVKERYAGFESTAIGKQFKAGKASLADLAAHATKTAEPPLRSGKHEKLESVFNAYAFGR